MSYVDEVLGWVSITRRVLQSFGLTPNTTPSKIHTYDLAVSPWESGTELFFH